MTSISASGDRGHPILGIRDFRLFMGGRLLSILSTQMQAVAVGWQVYDITHDPLTLGYVGLAGFLPIASLTLPAGDVADRFDRRRTLTFAYSVQGLCGLLFLGLTLAHSAVVWPFYVVMALFGVGRAFAGPSQQSFVPFLVPKPVVARAVAWSSSANQMGTILGPALGGAIYILGPGAVYATCLALFTASVASVAAIRTQVRIPPPEPGVTAVRRLIAGLAFAARTPIVLGAISLDLFAILLGGATAMLPVYAHDILNVGPEGLGMLRSAMAVGATTTALVLANMPLQRNAGLTMFLAVALFGVGVIVFALSTSFLLSLAALVVMGASDQVSVVTRNTVVQLATPETMRGRVSAVHMLFVGTSNELGEFRAGTMAAWLGAVPA
ncbi:MAG TPA: MFS transporter, partial [Alphaproteobacteria bacterium]